MKPPAPHAAGPGENDWQPTVPDGLSHQLENHARATGPPEIQRVKPEPAGGDDEKG